MCIRDSTVAREIMRNLPAEKIVYFGDTARVPYGSKSRETIIGYSRQIIRFLKEQKVKAIVAVSYTHLDVYKRQELPSCEMDNT